MLNRSQELTLEGGKADNRIVPAKAKGVGDGCCNLVLLLLIGNSVDVRHLINQVILQRPHSVRAILGTAWLIGRKNI